MCVNSHVINRMQIMNSIIIFLKKYSFNPVLSQIYTKAGGLSRHVRKLMPKKDGKSHLKIKGISIEKLSR